MPRRTTRVPTSPSLGTLEPNRHQDEKIFAWVQKGSKAVAGARATYTIFLWSNGGITCDCPGWIFNHRRTGGCKHTKLFEEEGRDLFRRYQRGEELPTLGEEETPTPAAPSTKPKKSSDDHSRLKYGRYIEMD